MSKSQIAFIVTIVTSTSVIAQTNNDLQKLEPKLREIFVIYDKNGDGIINQDEYKAWGSGAKHYDLNNDGVLLATEYQKYHSAGAKREAAEEKKSPMANGKIIIPPTGKYTCFGYGLNASGNGSGYVYKGHFFVKANSQYEANNTTGTFTLAANGGKTLIVFSKGAYKSIQGEVRIEKDGPSVVLSWPATKPGGTASTQYCSLTR